MKVNDPITALIEEMREHPAVACFSLVAFREAGENVAHEWFLNNTLITDNQKWLNKINIAKRKIVSAVQLLHTSVNARQINSAGEALNRSIQEYLYTIEYYRE